MIFSGQGKESSVSDSVYAVTVLYNNLGEIRGLMERLSRQTHPLSGVVCVDNSCAAQTDVILETIKSGNYGYNIQYYRTRSNIGSAGGYAVGMRAAHESGADWIWLNDQDGRPDYDCLESLLKTSKKNNKKEIAAPAVFCETEGKTLFLTTTGLFGKMIPLRRVKKGLKRVAATGTSGMLVHRSVIEKIGVYNSSVCFAGNEDFEFCRRAGAHGMRVYYAAEAGYFHPDVMVKRNKRELLLPCLLQKFMPYYLGGITEDSPASYKKCVSSAYINRKYNNRLAAAVNLFYSKARSFIGLRNMKFLYRKTLEAYKEGSFEADARSCIFKLEDYKRFLDRECLIIPVGDSL